MNKDKMKATDLIGKLVEVVVHSNPCRMVMPGWEPLEKTEKGRIVAFQAWPAGPVGFLEAEDGRKVCFDAGADIKNGTIVIEVPYDA